MKKLLILVLTVICMLSVFACNKNQVYFDATVIENNVVDLYTVEVTDKGTSGISPTSKAFIYGDKLPKNTPEFNVGDSIRVYFDGVVAEISPLDIGEVYKVEILK